MSNLLDPNRPLLARDQAILEEQFRNQELFTEEMLEAYAEGRGGTGTVAMRELAQQILEERQMASGGT